MRDWWTPREIVQEALPGLPDTVRGVNLLAQREAWKMQRAYARKRRGKGGGWEYHRALFPRASQSRIAADEALQSASDAGSQSAEAWAVFDALPDATKTRARAKLEAIDAVEALTDAGVGQEAAAREIANRLGKSERTIWNWMKAARAAPRADRLVALAPRHRHAARQVETAPCSPEAWEWLKADYMRPERPSMTSCYRRLQREAALRHWQVPAVKTLERRLEREIPIGTMVLARQGLDALKQLFPPQVRDKGMLHALECVNADGHKWDVNVEWEDGSIGRPISVVYQDAYSGRILSWRTDKTETWLSVMLSFGDMVERWGIPDHCIFDNGHAFAAKCNTGGVPNRYRFKAREGDVNGVIPAMGVRLHWTIPYSGRSKPVERAFKDLSDTVAKDPRLHGAWVGNRPDAKPANYGSRAVPIALFEEVLAEGMAEHNARTGRRSAVCKGRSFNAAFDESYAEAPIRKGTPQQLSRMLLPGKVVTACRDRGSVRLFENVYHAPFMVDYMGQRVTVRFDPGALHDDLHVYDGEGRYVGAAQCVEKTGFLDSKAAGDHQRAMRQFARAEKESLAALRAMTAIEISRDMAGIEEPERPTPKVVRGVFGFSGNAALKTNGQESPAAEPIDWAAYARGVEAQKEEEN